MRIVFLTLLLVAAFGLTLPAARAQTLTFDGDTTINLSGLGIDLTILSGSEAEEMTVNPGNVQFTMDAGQSVTVQSADGWVLNNSLNLNYSCSSEYVSQLEITSSISQVVTVTPSLVSCTTTTGPSAPLPAPTSSPGGGGGGSATTPAASGGLGTVTGTVNVNFFGSDPLPNAAVSLNPGIPQTHTDEHGRFNSYIQ